MTFKKLLICTPSNSPHGGVENLVNDLSREMPRRGWKTIVGVGKGVQFNNVALYREKYPDTPIMSIDGAKGTRQSRIESIVKAILKIKPDIVLSARMFDTYEAMKKIKKKNIRFAVMIRTYEPGYLFDIGLMGGIVDRCITAGNLIKQGVIKWSQLPEEIVNSIPSGVHKARNPVVRNVVNEPLRIGYVGRLEQQQKRIFDMIPFLKKLENSGERFLVDIIGCGPSEQKLKQRLANRVAKGCVRFHGWKTRSELYSRFYPAMDCLIHFAHTEGAPIAPREASIHGVVPIISQFTGLAAEGNFIHNRNALTFPVGDVTAAAENTKRLIKEPDLIRLLSSNAIKSQTNYMFNDSMDAWARALNQCIEKPPRKGIKFNSKLSHSGRLDRYLLSPWLAQRIRDVCGKRFIHSDPGSEWPTTSGLMTTDVEKDILKFAKNYEQKVKDGDVQL